MMAMYFLFFHQYKQEHEIIIEHKLIDYLTYYISDDAQCSACVFRQEIVERFLFLLEK